MAKNKDKNRIHRFIDEAGDTTFYFNGKKCALGSEGVSKSFLIGMVKISDPLEEVRKKIINLQNQIVADPFYHVASVKKKMNKGGYFLHATDDIPEVRKMFYDIIKTIDCSIEVIVARKSIELFTTKYKDKQEYLYADLVSHLLKNKFSKHDKMILTIAERGSSTRMNNLDLALKKAQQRFRDKNANKEIRTELLFNIQYPTTEPLLNLADYLCWAVQRVFEKGETRYYELIKEKISLVIDLYDKDRYKNWRNYYDNKKNPLTEKNKISSHLH